MVISSCWLGVRGEVNGDSVVGVMALRRLKDLVSGEEAGLNVKEEAVPALDNGVTVGVLSVLLVNIDNAGCVGTVSGGNGASDRGHTLSIVLGSF